MSYRKGKWNKYANNVLLRLTWAVPDQGPDGRNLSISRVNLKMLPLMLGSPEYELQVVCFRADQRMPDIYWRWMMGQCDSVRMYQKKGIRKCSNDPGKTEQERWEGCVASDYFACQCLFATIIIRRGTGLACLYLYYLILRWAKLRLDSSRTLPSPTMYIFYRNICTTRTKNSIQQVLRTSFFAFTFSPLILSYSKYVRPSPWCRPFTCFNAWRIWNAKVSKGKVADIDLCDRGDGDDNVTAKRKGKIPISIWWRAFQPEVCYSSFCPDLATLCNLSSVSIAF